MSTDEVDRLLEDVAEGSLLHRVLTRRAHAVEDAEVDAVVARLQARSGPRRRRWPFAVAAGVAVAAVALLATNLTRQPPIEPTWEVEPVPAEAAVRVRPSGSAPARAAEAEDWLAQGRIDDAILRYRLLLAEDPTGPRAARWQRGLVDALTERGDARAVVEAALDLVVRYGPTTAWHHRYGTPPETAAMARTLLAAAELAHSTGRSEGDVTLLDQASVAYELYLGRLVEPDREDEVRYAYGEVLYERQRYDEAWEQYRAVASDPSAPRARLCAEFAVFAAEEMAKATDEAVWHERFVDAADAYAEAYPDDPKSIDMQYKAAYAIYQLDPPASAERFESVAMQAPDRRVGGFAAQLALRALLAGEDFAGAAEFAAAWLEHADPEPEVRSALVEQAGEAAFEATRRAIAAGADPSDAWAAYRQAWPDGPTGD